MPIMIPLNLNDLTMDDPIAQHYSQSHSINHNYRKGNKLPQAFVLKKAHTTGYLGSVSGKDANIKEKDFSKLSKLSRTVQKRERAVKSDTDSEDEKPKKKKLSKHKRSRISEALGDDTY
jgi:hypothetical protein